METLFEEDEGATSSVLVVDDEPTVLDVLARVLAREPELEVLTAPTAEAAVGLLQTRSFDLLITDKNLPGMDGIELIVQARRLRPTIEAIMITGYASAQSVIAAFAAGASDYVVKPFDQISVVRAKIRAALDRRKDRVKISEESHQLALEASKLLAEGKTVSPPRWRQLDQRLAAYELAMRTDALGSVLVVGSEAAVAQLNAAGIDAASAEPSDLRLEQAAVVVIDTSYKAWRELANRLDPTRRDLLLTVGANHDLSELFEAIALKLDLVAIHVPGRLAEQVRTLLVRNAVQRAKQALAEGLSEFRSALGQ